MENKLYKVLVRKQHPAWDERDGFIYEISADSKSQAIKYARRKSDDDGHTGGGCGRAFYSAEETERFAEEMDE